ncbi:ABC transporter ATP-binding protein [Neobacillus sp. NPDC058068]|uniref:ABC transporter ATP-binding protein n=1 Tax=Neobacillus sp. NPDC058068 TaxID=3346325 RepID=UPI0036DF86BC
MIEFQNVSFTYKGAEKPALKEINLKINKGEIVLITGPSSAGKTTLCQAMNGLIPELFKGEMDGQVIIADQYSTKDYDITQLSKIVGLMFQDPDSQLLCPTVLEELAFGPENYSVPVEEIQKRIDSLLEACRLQNVLEKNPHALSGGQQQAVALASVLTMQPPVLVLDEPTSNIDPLGSETFLRLIKDIAKSLQLTVIIVEHKIEELASFVDRLVVMDEGKIILDGAPREVLKKVELMGEIGLNVPDVTLLAAKMKNQGCPIEVMPLNVEEAIEILEPFAITVREQVKKLQVKEQTNPIIKAKGLEHRYPDGTLALRGIDLTVHEGEMVAILGQNGSGKTTFSKHLNGILKATGGSLEVFGKEASSYKFHELSRLVGYVFQDPDAQIFKSKVRDEIAYGPKNMGYKEEEIAQLIEDVSDKLEIRHLLDTNPFFISKGDKQRIAVASVMAMRPKVLILDEPTTGQDFKRSKEIMDLTMKLHQEGITILAITHSMNLAVEYAKRVIVFRQGEVLLNGTPKEVFQQHHVLQSAMLKPPQITQFAQRMDHKGIPGSILTVDEMLPYFMMTKMAINQ